MDYLRRLLTGLGIAAGAGSIIGIFGGLWWGFDLLANFRLQYLIVLAVAAAALFAGGKRVGSALLAGIALYNAALIVPLYGNDPAPAANEARLEIVSANMQARTSRQMVNWLVATDPDLVFLFESSRQTEDLLREADLGYVVTSGIEPENSYGLSILSRGSVDFEMLPSARDGGDAVRLETRLGEQTVVVYAIHPPSPSNPTRSEARDKLLTRIGLAAADEVLPVVVVGDFNATPWSHGFRQLVEPGDLHNSQEGFGYGATWHADVWPLLGVPLDHLVHTRDLTVVDREVGPSVGPDHRPIRVVLARAAI